MYTYTGRGLGPRGGVLGRVDAAVVLRCFIAIAGLTGFAIFLQQLLGALG